MPNGSFRGIYLLLQISWSIKLFRRLMIGLENFRQHLIFLIAHLCYAKEWSWSISPCILLHHANFVAVLRVSFACFLTLNVPNRPPTNHSHTRLQHIPNWCILIDIKRANSGLNQKWLFLCTSSGAKIYVAFDFEAFSCRQQASYDYRS